MKRKLLLAAVIFATSLATMAEVPTNYYKSAYNKKKEELKTALYNIISEHTQVSSYNNLPDYFKKTDVLPGTNYWWDMYSDLMTATNIQFGTYMNREHSFPKSWWGGGTNTPAYTDLFHLYPAEAKANQAKSNYPLGEIKAGTTPYFTNGVVRVGTGVNSGGAKYVFEPNEEYLGDFARTYFYVVTCYQNLSWANNYKWQVMDGAYPTLQQWSIDLLLKWHRADPVSEKEVNRNEAVYKIQNNRNPFIDYPELAEYIWGNKMTQAWNPGGSTTTTTPTLYAPTSGMDVDFGQVALGKSVTRELLVRGDNLTGDLRLLLYGKATDGYTPSYFTIPGAAQTSGTTTSTISHSLASSQSGTWVKIVYTPTALGEHKALGSLNGGGGLNGLNQIAFNLRGECLPVPTLTKPINVAATDETTEGYTATWDTPADETVDYWILTRSIYSGNTVTKVEDIAESNELPVEYDADTDRESFTVRAVRLGYESPESDVVFVTRPAGIDGVDADQPLAIESHPGLIRVRCSLPQSSMTVIDMTGRIHCVIEGPIDDYYEFTLPKGVYLITTPEHRHPIKVLAH